VTMRRVAMLAAYDGRVVRAIPAASGRRPGDSPGQRS